MGKQLATLLATTASRVRARDVSDWGEKERLLLESCHPKQRAFVLDPGRRVAALVARGGGKTTADRARLVRRMLRTPKAKCLFIALTRDQALELMWNPLKDLTERLGIDATFNETTLRCTFRKNGAALRLVGADDKKQIEKYRGQPNHEVLIDEAASFKTELIEQLVYRIIGPRLGDYGGVLGMTGTPGHNLAGTFYDVTRPGSEISRPWNDRDKPEFENWSRWSFHRWSLQDGAPYVPALQRLWTEALLEKETNGWSDENPVWRREYLAEWAADDTERIYKLRAHLEDGTPWNVYDPPKDPRTGFAVLPKGNWRYCIGMDMGHADPFALVVLAYSPTDPTRTLYEVYEFGKKGMYAKTIAELLIGPDLDPSNPGGVIGVTGWPDAIVADTAGLGGSLLDELANVYGVQVTPAEKKAKFDNIELVNGDLIDGRIKVLKGGSLAKQMGDLQWAVDEYGQMREHKGQRNDHCDAWLYVRREVARLFAEEAPAPDPMLGRGEFHRIADNGDETPNQDDYSSILGDGNYTEDFYGI